MVWDVWEKDGHLHYRSGRPLFSCLVSFYWIIWRAWMHGCAISTLWKCWRAITQNRTRPAITECGVAVLHTHACVNFAAFINLCPPRLFNQKILQMIESKSLYVLLGAKCQVGAYRIAYCPSWTVFQKCLLHHNLPKSSQNLRTHKLEPSHVITVPKQMIAPKLRVLHFFIYLFFALATTVNREIGRSEANRKYARVIKTKILALTTRRLPHAYTHTDTANKQAQLFINSRRFVWRRLFASCSA